MHFLEPRIAEHFTNHSLESARYAVPIALASACFYLALFLFLQKTGKFSPKKQTYLERTDWNQRMVETVNGSLVFIGSLCCAWDAYQHHTSFTEPEMKWLFGYSFVQEFFAAAFIGYLLFDAGFNFWYREELWDTVDMIHHVIFIVGVGFYLFNGFLYKLQMIWLAVGELIVPFLNLRWHLAVLGRKDSSLYVANAWCLLVVFTLTKVAAFSAGLYHAWWLMPSYIAVPVPFIINQVLFVVFCGAQVMNLHWFVGVVKGVLRVYQRTQSSGSLLKATKPPRPQKGPRKAKIVQEIAVIAESRLSSKI